MKRILVFTLTFVFVLSLYGCGGELSPIEKIHRVESITGYDLPEDEMEELYAFVGETFVGFPSQYGVYALAEMPDFMKNLKELSSIGSHANTIHDSLTRMNVSVPEEYYPDSNAENICITGKEGTFIIYYPENQRLIIWVTGH